MAQPTTLAPTTQLAASRLGRLVGAALLVWAIGFSLLAAGLSPALFWVTLVAGSALIVCVPSWWFGKRAHAASHGSVD